MRDAVNLVITGLPRSGTSYLCARVNEFQNAAVINEPAEIFKRLKGGSIQGLEGIFDQYRRNILAGIPVPNKIKDGRFIEDTRREDSRSLHLHSIENESFTLGIKNTLIFLSMLEDILKSGVFPRIIASIRHPLDCIASWHSVSFPHLQRAKPAFLTDYATDSFARHLLALLREDNITIRSAMLWNLLAQTLLAAKGKCHLIRYEDMMTKPMEANHALSAYLGIQGNGDTEIEPSKPVKRRNELSSEQRDIIRSICKKTAVQFGYKLT